MNSESYNDAKRRFLLNDFSAANFFKQNGFLIEYAYCLLLLGNVEAAHHVFVKISTYDFRADWGTKLIQFINGYVTYLPSYFQIRNFLEIDLDMLIKAGQAQFVENIINGADLFYSVNPESYKFIARVMIYNNFTEIALHYLQKAKDKFYNDPEMHFMLANCYVKSGEINMAKKSLQNCLSILPEYSPAKKLQSIL